MMMQSNEMKNIDSRSSDLLPMLMLVEFLRHGSFFFERTLYTQVR